MLSHSEQDMKMACLLHCGDELSQARFLKECTPEKVLSYIEWSDAEIDSLQQECIDKDDEISKLEDNLEESKRELAFAGVTLETMQEKLDSLKDEIEELREVDDLSGYLEAFIKKVNFSY